MLRPPRCSARPNASASGGSSSTATSRPKRAGSFGSAASGSSRRSASAGDLAAARAYEDCADYLLFDTRCDGYGGSGRRFDWSVLDAYAGRVPFLLSGGIDAECAEAVRGFVHPRFAGMDLNSGFETAPAVKDAGKLGKFISKIQLP